jgi:hypothetical protein
VGARFAAPVQNDSGAQPASCIMGTGSFPGGGGKERPRRDADPSPTSSAVVMKELSDTSTPPMGRTACTELQCLYKGALYLLLKNVIISNFLLAIFNPYPANVESVCCGWRTPPTAHSNRFQLFHDSGR